MVEFMSRLGGLMLGTLLNSLWTLPVMVPTAVAAASVVQSTSEPRARPLVDPPALFIAVLAWPAISLGWAAAFGVSPGTPASPWHMRLLTALWMIQAVIGFVAVRRAPAIGCTRQLVAVTAVVMWWIALVALFFGSLAFGGAPI